LLKSAIKRRNTKSVNLGGVQIGDGAPVVVQSMISCDTRNTRAAIEQIHRLENAGCEVVRVAVPDEAAAIAIHQIRSQIHIPLIADIHFKFPLAIMAMNHGADGIRINPGNIPQEGIRQIVSMAKLQKKVIRIGINAGSLEKDIAVRHGGPVAEALVESAMKNIQFLEEMDFNAIKVSLKSSDVTTMIEAYRIISERIPYPLHLGVTEAGTILQSAIKSAMGIGSLLLEGIGDSIRVSVTGDPVPEISVAYGILRAINVRNVGPDIVSCPTCGRCEVDLPRLVDRIERGLHGMKTPLKIALMGCVVNGPGEASDADIGLAGGKDAGMLFVKGKIVRKLREDEFITVLLEEIRKMEKGLRKT